MTLLKSSILCLLTLSSSLALAQYIECPLLGKIVIDKEGKTLQFAVEAGTGEATLMSASEVESIFRSDMVSATIIVPANVLKGDGDERVGARVEFDGYGASLNCNQK